MFDRRELTGSELSSIHPVTTLTSVTVAAALAYSDAQRQSAAQYNDNFRDATNLFLGWTGTDGKLNIASSADGVTWNAPASLHPKNESSPTGPWLSILNGTTFLAWTGTDNHLVVESSTTWPAFGGKLKLPETSDHRPALLQNGLFYLSWTGRDSNHNRNLQISESGAMASDYKATYSDSSDNGLAPALFRQRVYLAWTETDSHVNVAVLSPGELHVFGLME